MRRLTIGATAFVAAVGLVACGGADGAEPNGASSDVGVSELLPEETRERGFLNVGGPVQAPPYIYKDDSGEMVGLTIDLVDAAAASLGVQVQWHDTSYDSASPALEADRIDLFTGSYADTAERQKQVDFLDYYLLEIVLVTQEGNPQGINNLDDLCGLTAAVARGSAPIQTIQAQNEVCAADGKPEITMSEIPSNSDVKLQVESGRADAMFDHLAGARWMESDGQPFEMVPEPVSSHYAGAAFSKTDTQLRDAMAAGFTNIIEDGTYGEILAEWNVPELAMDEVIVNGATTAPIDR